MISRRKFLTRLAAGATGSVAAAGNDALAYTRRRQRRAPRPEPHGKLDRIAISAWSVHNYFRATRESTFDLPGPVLVLLDLPEVIIGRYSLHHFELCASQFPSTEPAYLQELKYTMVRTHSTIVNLCVDIKECGPEGDFSASDPDQRLLAVEEVKSWVEVAHLLGARSVSAGPGKIEEEKLTPTAESYRALAAYARARDIRVLVENRNGFGSEQPELLLKLFKLVGHGQISALPAFANFLDKPTRQQGLEMLFPYAETVCHVQGMEFDADGAEREYDFAHAMEIAKKAGFAGFYSIEFRGSGDPYAGIQKTLNELLKYL